MTHLARKFSRAKWDRKPYLAPDEIRADALTRCLRTTDDSLSFWRCESTEADVDEVALALATGMERLEKIDVVLVEERELRGSGLRPEPSEGRTPVGDLRGRHVDVVHLDAGRLGTIARCVADAVHTKQTTFFFTRGRLKGILRRAIEAGRVRTESLKEKVQAEVSESFQ